VVRDVYLRQRSPDFEEAMAKGAQEFKKTFGLSTTYGPDPTAPKEKWGRPRLMQYAPAAWPGYAPRGRESPLEDIEGLIKKLAVSVVEKAIGGTLGRSADPNRIILTPVNFKDTAERFVVADPDHPPVYLLSYQDKRGNFRTIGTFDAKPWELREIQSAEREPGVRKREAVEKELEDKRLLNMPQGIADRKPIAVQIRRHDVREEWAKQPSILTTAKDAVSRTLSGTGAEPGEPGLTMEVP
jgi:hypothetical protein